MRSMKSSHNHPMKKTSSKKEEEKEGLNIKPVRRKNNTKINYHTNSDIEILWKIENVNNLFSNVNNCIVNCEVNWRIENWKQNLLKTKEYIDKYNKRPSSTDKNKEIKFLGVWVCTQKTNYRPNIEESMERMKDKEIHQLWNEFINDDKYKKYIVIDLNENWKQMLQQTKEYINNNKKLPSIKTNDFKSLKQWITRQKSIYSVNIHQCKYIMKDIEIHQLWTKFINDEMYKKYIIYNIYENWKQILQQVKEYINNNNKLPSSKDKNTKNKFLGSWVQVQKRKYSANIQHSKGITKNTEIHQLWTKFINNEKYKKYIIIYKNENWKQNLQQVKEYIDINNKRPPSTDKHKQIKSLGIWLVHQIRNFENIYKFNCNYIIKDQEIHQLWTEFITNEKYKKYIDLNENWKQNLMKTKEYINVNNKLPSQRNKDKNILFLGHWVGTQQKNYNVNIQQSKRILKDPEIHKLWSDFINDPKYIQYFKKSVKKSVKLDASQEPIQEQKEETEPRSTTLKQTQQSEYQEISKKMATQSSRTTHKMIQEDEQIWHKYHANRDVSFEGYEDQSEIPLNKITAYLETKSSRRLKILDLGCGRNKIQEKFASNDKLSITGYDYVSHNGSQVADIRELPEEDESVDICVFSQSLMGSNWKEYIKEAKRVLRYNGEMIISESVNRFDTIKAYIEEEDLHIKYVENNENKRWFYMYVIND